MTPRSKSRLAPTQEDFRERFAPGFFEMVLELLAAKGEEYSRKGAFDNFDKVSQIMGISREEDLMTAASKHWIALADWSKGTKLSCTSAEERIMDIIVYLTLLAFMIQVSKGETDGT